MSEKNEISENCEITFVIHKAEDGKTWQIQMTCDEEMSDGEAAEALIVFSEDLKRGLIDFVGVDEFELLKDSHH